MKRWVWSRGDYLGSGERADFRGTVFDFRAVTCRQCNISAIAKITCGGALYAETDGAGNVLREYITLGGATIAIVDVLGMSFVHSDRLGAPQVMTDGSAAVVWDASYRPFGEATVAGLAANDQRFPGQYEDAETGYYDNWNRTYDPTLGRYLQSDPIGILVGFNTYAYAGGNPVMFADPDGRIFWPVFFATAADGVGMGLTLYAIGNFGLRWYDNYRAGGCTDLWGSRPEISPWGVVFFAAGPLAKAGKWAFGPLAATGKGFGKKFGNFPPIKTGSAGGPNAGKPFPQSVKDAAKAENPGAVCVYCRRPGTGTQVDHAISRKRGGNPTLDNAQMACEHCNPSKGAGDFPKSPYPG